MDPTTLGIGIAVTAVMVCVLAAIAKFGFGGEADYEQTIAHHKEVLLDEHKPKPSDKKLKVKEKKKRPSGRGKPDGVVTSASEVEDEAPPAADALDHPHVEYDPDPVVIDSNTNAKAQPSKKTEQVKSILHNRDEAPVVKEDAVVQETVFSTANPPKDVLELKHDKAKKPKKEKAKSSQASGQAKVEKKIEKFASTPQEQQPQQSKDQPANRVPIVEEMVVAKAASTAAAPPPAASGSGNAKKSKQVAKVTSHDLSSIMELINEAVLTRDDLQSLVDSILARQSEDSWTTKSTKQDPLTLLRKQLEEVQAALEAERANSSSAQAKIKEMNNRMQTAERTSSSASHQIQELQRRLQQTVDGSKIEIKSLTDKNYRTTQMVEQQETRIKQLTEDNEKLKQSVADSDQVAHMQNQIRSLQADLQQSRAQLTDADKNTTHLNTELIRYKESIKHLEEQKSELSQICNDVRQQLSAAGTEKEAALSKITSEEESTRNTINQLRSQVADRDSQLQALGDKLRKNEEQMQQSPATNGDHHAPQANGVAHDTSNLDARISSLEQTVSAKDTQIASLNKQLTAAKSSVAELDSLRSKLEVEAKNLKSMEAKVAALQEDLQKAKNKNNDLIRKNWSLNDALQAADSVLTHSSIEEELHAKTSLAQMLRENNDALQARADKLEENNTRLTEQLKQVATLQDQLSAASQTISEQKNQIQGLEKSLAAERAHLTEIQQSPASSDEVKQLKVQTESLKKDSDRLKKELDDLKSQKSTSSSDGAEQYKTALTDVESMLDELSSKFDAEMIKWKSDLRGKDAEILDVKQSLQTARQELNQTRDITQRLAQSEESIKSQLSEISRLTGLLEEANHKLVNLEEKAQEQNDSAAQAAAKAASGEADDNGTCV